MSSGFTLTELLVVIAVIAVLASILLPAVNVVRSNANSAKCRSALRQLGTAHEAYAQQWQRVQVPVRQVGVTGSEANEVYWFEALAPYADSSTTLNFTKRTDLKAQNTIVWGCPTWNREHKPGAAGAPPKLWPGFGMPVRPMLPDDARTSDFSDPAAKTVPLAKISTLANRMLFAESDQWQIATDVLVPATGQWLPETVPDPYRHAKSVNAVFHDLHVGNHLRDKLLPTYLDPKLFSP